MYKAIAAALAAGLFSTVLYAEGDRACTREISVSGAVAPADLDAIFARVARLVQATAETPAPPPAAGEFVVARIGADGKLILGCVDSADAAKRFLTAPPERVRREGPEEH